MWQKLATWIAPVFFDWVYKKVAGLIQKLKAYLAYRKEQKAIDAASDALKDRVISAQTPGERDQAADETFKNS